MKNDRTLSTVPPRKPDSRPITMPTTEAITVATVAMRSETRQP